MAVFVALRGQTSRVPLTIQFTKGDGSAINPTGAVELRVYYAEPGGSLTLKANVAPTQQAGLTGFWGAFLDVADVVAYPEGDYVLRWAATVDGIATATQDTLEINAAAQIAGTGAAVGAYCSEAEIRNWALPMQESAVFTTGLVAEKAAQASDYIDARLRARYVVPFSAPYDELIVLLNIWLAVAYLFSHAQSEAGNENSFREELLKRVEETLDAILAGEIVLSVDPAAGAGGGSTDSTTIGAKRVFELDLDNPTSTVLGRW